MVEQSDVSIKPWPCAPDYFTEYLPEQVAEVVIAGISERLQQPVVLVEKIPSKDAPNVIYGVSEDQAYKRYPKFCRLMGSVCCSRDQTMVCRADSEDRAIAHLAESVDAEVTPKRCHSGITTFSRSIRVLGRPIAVCSAGKFLMKGDRRYVQEQLTKYLENNLINQTEWDELTSALESDDLKPPPAGFSENFIRETDILRSLAKNYMSQKRHEKEWWIRGQVLQKLLSSDGRESAGLGYERDRWERIQGVIEWINTNVPVKWVALFLSQKAGRSVLPLAASSGLTSIYSGKLHFYWDISGLGHSQSIIGKSDFSYSRVDSDFKEIIQNGLKFSGEPSSSTIQPNYLFASGSEFKGVFLIGEWNIPTDKADGLLENHGGRVFLEGLGQLLLAHAISKWAQAEVVDAFEFRTRYAALAAHTMRASVHRLWEALDLYSYFNARQGRENDASTAFANAKRIAEDLKEILEVTMAIRSEGEGWESSWLIPFRIGDLKLRSLSIAAIIEDCKDTFRHPAESKQISIRVADSVYSLSEVRGDLLILQIAFKNIIDNAIKYSRPKKEVRIFGQESGKSVKISVQDVGWEIPEDGFEDIFKEGFQSPVVKKFARRGKGLGLFQAKGYIEAHGGSIAVKSGPRNSDSGSSDHLVTVTIELPISGPALKTRIG